MEGNLSVIKNEWGIRFHPEKKWPKGIYTLEVETKLEDSAGNNLLRPFDRDIMKDRAPSEALYVRRSFKIS